MKCQYMATTLVEVASVRRRPVWNRHAQQRAEAAENVQPVRRRENVKKAAARIGIQINAGARELPPGDQLSDEEENAERGGHVPPVPEIRNIVAQKIAARTAEREAADHQDRGVQPQDFGNCESAPIRARAFANDVGADERHEEHQNAAERHGHAGNVRPLAGRKIVSRAAAITAASRAAVSPGPMARVASSQ